MKNILSLGLPVLSVWLVVGLLGCGEKSTTVGVFESDAPNAPGSPGTDAGTNGGPPKGDDSSPDPERAILEADIVQVVGDRLFALSRVAGLAVIDVSNPARLRMLGQDRELPATPFEMYVLDDVAIVMFSSWGEYVKNGDDYQFVQTSKVVALDVKDPTSIKHLGSFDIPGEVSDSRIVGDVLYVVGYQNGWCWGCEQNKPLTSIVSIDVANVRAMRKVDELRFEDGKNQWGWNRRSVTVTTSRMYVAGPEYSDKPTGSTIQVVDISDPKGEMIEGTMVSVDGQVSSRWQMDEYQGTLRVISQTPQWSTASPPVVQTFTISSSKQIDPLGRVELTLPKQETLQSVRFDGDRAYAITAERSDPLFTLDLRDPAHPMQVGELEMPGFIYHMVPRGNRVLGLGFDQGNDAGAITVSLFDVSDLSMPKMLSRVNFGGTWGSLPEDQDRIHKAFKVLDELGLILVPFSGWKAFDNDDCSGQYGSGAQLIDFANDTLTLRGSVGSHGEARRALVHDQTLLTVSDERVEAYDFTDRDAPKPLTSLAMARNVQYALPLSNELVARVSPDWWTRRLSLDLVDAKNVERADLSLGSIDLENLLGTTKDCNSYTSITAAFGRGKQIDILYQRDSWRDDKSSSLGGVAVIDASDPSAPRLSGKVEWPRTWFWYNDYYYYGYYGNQTSSVRTSKATAMLEAGGSEGANTKPRTRLRVVDVSDPAKPTSSYIALQEGVSYAGLVVSGDLVATSHYEAVGGGKVRFYVDRFDLSNPAQPVSLAAINVPGALMHYDAKLGRVITSELRRQAIEHITSAQCSKRLALTGFEYDVAATDGAPTPDSLGTCTGFTQRLNLVALEGGGAELVDSYLLTGAQMVASSSFGDDRVFASIHARGYYGYGYADVAVGCAGPCYTRPSEPAELLVLGGLATNRLKVGHIEVGSSQNPWWGFWGASTVYAAGKSALVISQGEAAIVDAADATAPKLVRTHPLPGWSWSTTLHGSDAYVASGEYGVTHIDLAP